MHEVVHQTHSEVHTCADTFSLVIPDMHHEIDCKVLCVSVGLGVCVLIKFVSRGRLLSPPTCLKSSEGVNVTLGLASQHTYSI